MGLTNFRASDFEGSAPVKNMVRSTKDRLAGPQATSKPLPQGNEDPEAVPSGTVPEVLTWVGDDPVRAQKALDVELKNDRPRKGLVSELTEKANTNQTHNTDTDKTVDEMLKDPSYNDISAKESEKRAGEKGAVKQSVKADDGTDATEPTKTEKKSDEKKD